MKIVKALFVPGSSAFYFDDQRAIKAGAPHDGVRLRRQARDPGIQGRPRRRRSPVHPAPPRGRELWPLGDCAAVQYSGAGGRDPLFLAADYLPLLETAHPPAPRRARGRPLPGDGRRLRDPGVRRPASPHRHPLRPVPGPAPRPGPRPASRIMAEVVCEEYGLPVVAERVPIFGQSGDDRYINADKMILKRVDVLPHALINNVDDKLGREGELLREYIGWLVDRIRTVRTDESYRADPPHRRLRHDRRRSAPSSPAASPTTWPRSSPWPPSSPSTSKARSTPRRSPARSSSSAAIRRELRGQGLQGQDRGRRVVQHLRGRRRFHRRPVLRHGPDQDARPRRHPEHHRERPLLPQARHGSLPGRHLQRDRRSRPGLRPRRRGRPGRAPAGQAGHGLRRRLHDRPQRDGARPGRAPGPDGKEA